MRTWSWKLARIAGIDVYVHATFFIVVVWIGLVYWNQDQNLAAVFDGVGYILTLFTCVGSNWSSSGLSPHTRIELRNDCLRADKLKAPPLEKAGAR